MKPEHKKYILENINKKSIKNISEDLNLKERKIRKFLQRQKKKQIDFQKETKISVKRKVILISITLIIILGFVTYGNSLKGSFLWDDEFLVKDNIYIKSWSRIPEIFTKDIGAGVARKYSFYRPLQIFTYMIDYSLWRLNVMGYHLSNTVFHILVALCIYWLINIIYGSNLISLFTSIFFVIHPIHTEAVAYLSGRADLLVSLFTLLCFILYIKSLNSESIVLYTLMLLSYILALASRENSLILPILLLLYHYAFGKKIKPKPLLSLLIITFIYILLRLTVLKFQSSTALIPTTFLQRLPGFFVAISNYTRLILLPFNLHMEYGNKLFSLTDLKAILGAVTLFSLLIYIFRIRNTHKLIFFSVYWFFLTLLPQSNLYPITAYMAEHWLYIPSIGFFLILANGLSYLWRTRNLKSFAIVSIIGLLVFYSYLTIQQNTYWREALSFYERTLKYAPNSPRVLNNLGLIYSDIGRKEEAVALYKKTTEISPDDVYAYNNLGNAYKDMGRYEEAIIWYKKAIEVNTSYAAAYHNLGLTYKDIGKNDEAIAMFKRAIELNPIYVAAYNNLANIYKEMGREEEAVALYKEAIEIDPTSTKTYYNLSNVYDDGSKKKEAMALLMKAVKMNPHNADAYNNLGNAYQDIDKYEEAITSYKRAIELDPIYIDAYNNLANIYRKMGKNDEAIALYKKAIKIEPHNINIYNNLANVYNEIGKSEEAMTLYKKAMEINPNFVEAYYNLGNVYKTMGKYEGAIAMFKKAIEINPNYLDAYNNLGAVYTSLGKKKQAIDSFEKAIEINPNYAKAYKNLAVIYYYEKQYDLAIQYYDKAIKNGYKADPNFLELIKPFRNKNSQSK